jgi:hypothetical protein
MSKNLNDINNNNKSENKKENITNKSINNLNINNPIKNYVSEQLIFFKEDILKELKQLETQMTLKYKAEKNKNDAKIIKMEETIESLSKNFEIISSSINKDNTLHAKIENLSELFPKLEETVNTHELKLKNSTKKFTEDIYNLDNKITENIFYPLIIGPKGRYKTFHEFIDFVLFNINNLLVFKEKTNSLLKDLKNKTEANIKNLKVNLDYQTKNCNAFTSSSIKESELKINNAWNENLNFEIKKINQNFENYKKNLEEKILDINKKLQKIEENFEKIENEKKEKSRLNKDIEKYQNEKSTKYFLGSRRTTSIIKQYIEGNLKDNQLVFKRRTSFDKNLSESNDTNNKVNIKNSNKTIINNKNKRNKSSIFNLIKNRRSTKSEFKNEKLYEEKSSVSETSEKENNTELRKSSIKEEINKILINNVKTYNALKKLEVGKDQYISSFLRLLYPESIVTPNKSSNNINNKIQLIKDNENIPFNKDLYITNSKERESLHLLKNNSQPLLNSANIKNNNEIVDINDILSPFKKQNKENFLPVKIMNKNQKNQNKINRNKALMSLTFKPNSTDKIFLNNNNKDQNQKNVNDIFKKQNQNEKINKSQYNKVNMNFSDFQENNKEKDKQKMKKIFNDLKDVIQEDEKFLIKKRFANYGYNKDIIFYIDKKEVFCNNDENKNNIFKVNNKGLKVRPNSKSFKKQ